MSSLNDKSSAKGAWSWSSGPLLYFGLNHIFGVGGTAARDNMSTDIARRAVL